MKDTVKRRAEEKVDEGGLSRKGQRQNEGGVKNKKQDGEEGCLCEVLNPI